MKGSSTNPRTGPNGAPLWSASQVVKLVGLNVCHRRWAFERLAGIKEPPSKAMEAGSAYHLELENWAKYGIAPESKVAKRALKLTRIPVGVCEVEVPVRFDHEETDTSWLGFIDLAYDTTKDRDGEVPVLPIGSTGWTVIQDWKFTGKKVNMKTSSELSVDPAACLYAYEAYLGGAEHVSGRWVYTGMGSDVFCEEVWFSLDRDIVTRIVNTLGQYAAAGNKARRLHKAGLLKVLDLGANSDRCYDYGRLCHLHGTHCTPEPKALGINRK